MKSRQVTFFVDLDELPLVMSAVVDEVLPRFSKLPHLLGFTILKSDIGRRSEIVALSFWDDGLHDSEAVSEHFISEIYRVTGQNASRREFDILFAMSRESSGEIRTASM